MIALPEKKAKQHLEKIQKKEKVQENNQINEIKQNLIESQEE